MAAPPVVAPPVAAPPVNDHLPSEMCPFLRIPPEVWLEVLSMEPTRYWRHRMLQSLLAVCRHARQLAAPHAFARICLHAPEMYVLQQFVADQHSRSTVSVFDYTTRVRVLCPHSEIRPVMSMVSSAFSRLTSLSILLRPLHDHLSASSWLAFSSSWRHLDLLLSNTSLRHLAIYVFVSDAYNAHRALSLSHFIVLQSMVHLETLSLRLGGGIECSLDNTTRMLFPTSVHTLHLSLQVFELIDSGIWPMLTSLTTVHVEDGRMMPHLRGDSGHSQRLHTFSSAVCNARTAWSTSLTTFCLIYVHIDSASLLALAALSSLTRLDFHPASVYFPPGDPLHQQCRVIAPHVQFSARHPSRVALSGVGPFAGQIYSSEQAHILVPALKYLLSHLERLEVLHFSIERSRVSPQKAQSLHLDLFDYLAPHIHPALSLWQISTIYDCPSALYLHLPTCAKCHDEAPGARSTQCQKLQASHEIMRENPPCDTPDCDEAQHMFESVAPFASPLP